MEAIAVIGMACRFPGSATSPEKLWKMMVNKESAWTEFPKDRLNIHGYYHPSGDRQGSISFKGAHFLRQNVAAFDASFFSVMAEDAKAMDPQQRLLLEVSYEALENAGLPIEGLRGTPTAVYVGSFVKDYEQICLRDMDWQPQYAATGTGNAIMSNRISYTYDFKGPSMTIDTGCSGSLVAVHLAAQALRSGDCSLALAAGAGMILTPNTMMPMTALNFLSPDGKCFAFDSRANGYGRGEGIGFVVLKRLSDAVKDNDTIRAVIRGTHVNQDGSTPGITLPSKEAQVANIRHLYSKHGLDMHRTAFVECHGTGTQAGDTRELKAISETLSVGRHCDNPVLVGSVKTNIGHLEGAAGIAGLIKGVLIIEKGEIPPNINFEKGNPDIKFEDWGVKVPTDLTRWPLEGPRRVALVDLLRCCKVTPSSTIGHSSGEIAAAYASGCINSETALTLAYYRGQSASLLSNSGSRFQGGMCAVKLSLDEARQYLRLAGDEKDLQIACINSPTSVTISGSVQDIIAMRDEMKTSNILCKILDVQLAYHSRHMNLIKEKYGGSIAGIISVDSPTGIRFFSTVCGGELRGRSLGPSYWTQNLVSPVQFWGAVEALIGSENRPDVFVEISPQVVLESAITEIVSSVPAGPTSRGHTKKSFSTLVDLPSYPWNHSNTFWHESHTCTEHRFRNHGRQDLIGSPSPDATTFEPRWRGFFRISENPWIQDHRVQQTIVYPAAGMVAMAIEAASQMAENMSDILGFQVINLHIERAMVIAPTSHGLEYSLNLKQVPSRPQEEPEWDFSLYSKQEGGAWLRHADGQVKIRKSTEAHALHAARHSDKYSELEALCGKTLLARQLYETLDVVGLNYGPCFQNVSSVSTHGTSCISKIRIPDTKSKMPANFEYPHVIHPATLDSMFHPLFAIDAKPMVPSTIESVFVSAGIPKGAGHEFVGYALARRRGICDATASIYMAPGPEDLGSPSVVIEGLQLSALSASPMDDGKFLPNHRNLCSEIIWKEDYVTSKTDDLSQLLSLMAHKYPLLAILQCGGSEQLARYILEILSAGGPPRLARYTVTDDQTLSAIQTSFTTSPVLNLLEKREWPTTKLAEEGGKLYIPRLMPLDELNRLVESESSLEIHQQPVCHVDNAETYYEMVLSKPGLADDCFHFCATPFSGELGSHEVEIRTSTAVLREEDLKTALGLSAEGRLGLDICGFVTNVGSQVEDFRPGDQVCAIVPGAFKTVHRIDLGFVKHSKPAQRHQYTPSIFITAFYAMCHAGYLSRNKKVLIHAGASSYGQAAVRVAGVLEAEVFATVLGDATGTQRKQLVEVCGLPRDHILDADSEMFFADLIAIGKFDVIFNITKDHAVTSSKCVKASGRIIQLVDKTNRASIIPASAMTCVKLDIGLLLEEDPELVKALFTAVDEFVSTFLRSDSDLQCEPVHNFALSSLSAAYKHLRRHPHFGLVVMTVDQETRVPVARELSLNPLAGVIDPLGTYILAGGLGGLGRSIANLLAVNGARRLVFLSRSRGGPNAEAFLDGLRAEGVDARAVCVDITDREALQTHRLSLGKISGVVQCAAVIKDALFETMTYSEWTTVFGPKAIGAINLVEVFGSRSAGPATCADDADSKVLAGPWFIFLSSASGVIGNRGQANYAAGNAVQDALARSTPRACSLDLGPVLEAGMLAQNDETLNKLRGAGFYGIRHQDFLKMVSYAIAGEIGPGIPLPAQIISGVGTGGLIRQNNPGDPFWSRTSLYSYMNIVNVPVTAPDLEAITRPGHENNRVKEMLAVCTGPDEAANVICAGLVQLMAKAMTLLPEEIDPGRRPSAYGVDSLVAVGVRN
ncbi:Highly reducing polyketide synthase azaB [Colletotrichum spinosum]|uniref:Highly reducing polyketide synthase azaB n=1 Tax=Colletotrichum spinosum TaxID=1347390 RepID=A0A4V3HQX4_9PEZI|nr:Highly reducing polyketide synthase azaB [Colletotrichum spinosum]